MRSKYATVKIPQELASRLDEFVSNMGYRSRAEIVNDAIRRFIDERKRLDNQTAAKE
jgi:metal-responsive CopG/Arc/MetJ family transcriptional regulator